MNTHPGGWKIELYVMGKLGSPESTSVVRMEEHLLRCHRCIERAEKITEFVRAMRVAMKDTPPESVACA